MGVLDHLMEIPGYLVFFLALRYLGWYGLFAFLIGFELYKRGMKHYYKLEHMSGTDALWLNSDGPKNVGNIVAMMRFERFDGNQMKDHIMEKALQFTRNRSRVVKKYASWWMEEMSTEWCLE